MKILHGIYITIMVIKINIDYIFYNFLFLMGRDLSFNKYSASEGAVKSFRAVNGWLTIYLTIKIAIYIILKTPT